MWQLLIPSLPTVPYAGSREDRKNSGSHDKEILRGWVFFEVRGAARGPDQTIYLYTGVGKVFYNTETKTATFARKTGRSGGKVLFNVSTPSWAPKFMETPGNTKIAGNMRSDQAALIWKQADEPRFGSLCAVLGQDDYIYLYGQIDEQNKDINVARVPADKANFREHYTFWTGSKWSQHVSEAAVVMPDMQHGQIFKSKMFGKAEKFEWVFVGCNGQGDSRVQMGRAKTPEVSIPWFLLLTRSKILRTVLILWK